ncbi:MAG: helix-hairpin-helix domain-containing protein [Candidatus Competibacteraceae bacterium]
MPALLHRLDAVEADLLREQNRQEKTQVVTQPDPVDQSLQQQIAFLEQEAARLQAAIHEHIDQFPNLRQDRELLKSIPAVGEKTAQRWLVILRRREFQDDPSLTFKTVSTVSLKKTSN